MDKSKEEIRKRIWDEMERRGIARFPKPIYGRIPNFVGAERAASRLIELPEFKDAKVVKVNPDTPQRMVRYYTLTHGKLLLTPTPRLKQGFILLDASKIPHGKLMDASTISGSFIYGERVDLKSLPRVDFIVMGSVAVSLTGCRLGKGGGYGEIEYAILRELKCVDETTPIATTVHDIQIVNNIPLDEYDVTLDIIVTPTRTIRVN
ncbi:MAG: 5-formyltetrahydrofolate cyclo-ligase, partial [Nitrososphaerales archaeon]|nr:5-formyltetrahydrofolate cyclo-ligase [Nitrososphaerales archaeon]